MRYHIAPEGRGVFELEEKDRNLQFYLDNGDPLAFLVQSLLCIKAMKTFFASAGTDAPFSTIAECQGHIDECRRHFASAFGSSRFAPIDLASVSDHYIMDTYENKWHTNLGALACGVIHMPND